MGRSFSVSNIQEKEKQEAINNREEIKDMVKERNTLKKLIRQINIVSGEIFKKNEYFDDFEKEIKNIEISSFSLEKKREILNYKEKHFQDADKIMTEIKFAVIEQKGVLSKDLLKRLRDFVDEMGHTYKKPQIQTNKSSNQSKNIIIQKLEKENDNLEEYLRVKSFLNKTCEFFTSKQIQVVFLSLKINKI